MRGQLSYVQGNLSLLREMNWIDKQTRAVFVEFSTYNPNINLIMVSTILVEFTSTGTILATARFDPLNLFNDSTTGNMAILKTICEILFYAFIVYLAIVQLIDMANMSLTKYLGNFWIYIEWSIIISALVSFAMLIYRLGAAQQVLNFFKITQGYGYMNLQRANESNQILTFSLGICVFLSSVKLLKLLRFNASIALLGSTLKLCFVELTSFSLVFFIIWFSFVQMLFILFRSNLIGYSTLIISMETAFQTMLGKFDVTQYMQTYQVLGPLVFAAYNITIITFALNIFISIITQAFEQVRRRAKVNPNRFDLWGHIKARFFFKVDMVTNASKYKNFCDSFEKRVDLLIVYFIRVSINTIQLSNFFNFFYS